MCFYAIQFLSMLIQNYALIELTGVLCEFDIAGFDCTTLSSSCKKLEGKVNSYISMSPALFSTPGKLTRHPVEVETQAAGFS